MIDKFIEKVKDQNVPTKYCDWYYKNFKSGELRLTRAKLRKKIAYTQRFRDDMACYKDITQNSMKSTYARYGNYVKFSTKRMFGMEESR